MANMLTRIQVAQFLQHNNVTFDDEATMTQLRPLYDDLLLKLSQQQPGFSENSTEEHNKSHNDSLIELEDDSDKQAAALQLQQQQFQQQNVSGVALNGQQQPAQMLQQQQQQLHGSNRT